jgi:hypothetical protein
MSLELVPQDGPESSALVAHFARTMILDRADTRRLLRRAERLMPGIVCAQLRGVLERRDWLVISVVADPATVFRTGVNIGIVQASAEPRHKKSPMQKWQAKHGMRGSR